MTALAPINALDRDAFVALLGSLYEHSPWAAERAWANRPFADEPALAAALRSAVDSATNAEKLDLIRAHPELAGEKLRARALTASSMSEQGSIGLDKLGQDELAEWSRLNAAYRDRFGFPFVICVRLHTKDEIIAAMRRRLASDPATESAQALRQIHDIAHLRLADLMQRQSSP